MRPILVPSGFLLLAACATEPAPVQTQVSPAPVSPYARGTIIGLTAEQLAQRFGMPALQIREGESLKLQFRSNLCVLDAYLYPPAPGRAYQVTYVDTRTRSMNPIDQTVCIASLGAR